MRLPALDRLGRPGIVGIGLLLFCASYYSGNLAPGQEELARLENQAQQLAATARPGTAPPPAGRTLPAFGEATAALKALAAVAQQHGLAVDQASYRVSDKDGLRRLEVGLPVKAAYPALRAYLRDVLALPAAPVLDELSLQRVPSGEAQVEASLRLSFYFTP
ncbi:MAG TPA: GspMb/PilO family protein [Azonexus sp.]